MATNLVFRFLTLASVLLLGFIATANSQGGKDVIIVRPHNNDRVGAGVIVEGTVKISDGSRLWVLVRPTPDNNPDCHYTTRDWYPQRQPKVSGGVWKGAVVIGHSEKDVGCKYEIAAATFGKESEAKIKKYFEEGDELDVWTPIPFPEKISNSDIVIVEKSH